MIVSRLGLPTQLELLLSPCQNLDYDSDLERLLFI
jgi:hypothetical protein